MTSRDDINDEGHLTNVSAALRKKTVLFAKFNKQIEIMAIAGVRVFAHVSVLMIGALILLLGWQYPLISLAKMVSYFAIILLHEVGHMVAAQRKHCYVSSIELYPFWGVTHFSEPYSRLDHCVIAWAGVAAQAIVAVPLIVCVKLFGYTPFDFLNELLNVLGFYSMVIAAFNLLPVAPLDGKIAWGLFPALRRRQSASARSAKRGPAWRSWR